MGEENIEKTYLKILPGTVIAMGSGLLATIFFLAIYYNILEFETALFLMVTFIFMGMLTAAMNLFVSGFFLKRRHRCLKCGAREHTLVRKEKFTTKPALIPIFGDTMEERSEEFVLECSCCGNKHKYIYIIIFSHSDG